MREITTDLLSRGFDHIRDDNFLVSYPMIISAFSRQTPIDSEFLLFAAHATYGWMPRALNWTKKQWDTETMIIEEIRVGRPLTEADMKKIVALINRSISGASKLIHFIAPARFPILDSHIYTYLKCLPYREQPMNCSFYISYRAAVDKVTQMSDFPSIRERVERRLGYNVSSIRAAELLLFYLSLANKKEARRSK